MPITFSIDTVRRRLSTCASGAMDGDTLIDYYRRLREHADFANDLDEVFDLSAVDELTLDARDIARFSVLTEPFTRLDPPVRIAIIAPHDAAFGLSRMYEMLQTGSSNELRVFRDRDAAERWIERTRSA